MKKQTKQNSAARTATKKGATKQTKHTATANATRKTWPPPAAVLVEAYAIGSGEKPPEDKIERAKWLFRKFNEDADKAEAETGKLDAPTEESRAICDAVLAAMIELCGLEELNHDGNYPPRLDDGREWIDREDELEAAVSALPKEVVEVANAFCVASGLDSIYFRSVQDSAYQAGMFCLQAEFRVEFLNRAKFTDAASMRAALSALSLADTRAALDAFAANPSAETFDDARAALGRALDEWKGRCMIVALSPSSNPATKPTSANADGKPTRTRGKGIPVEVKYAVLDWIEKEYPHDDGKLPEGKTWKDAYDEFISSPECTPGILTFAGSWKKFRAVAEAARKYVTRGTRKSRRRTN